MAMLSNRLRRVLVALPSCIQRSFSLSRASDFPSVSSLVPRSVVRQPREFGRSPAKLFSTTQYQYDPYTGEDSFTPDNEGCDFNHWLITMDFPKENPPSREEMISIFEQTCAKGLGISLEEAKKKMYAICTTSYQGFQATMTIGEVEKFRDLPGVQYIIPDSYVDVENKVYGGDKYEDGVITPGPIPVPTREGFDSLDKESMSEQAQISQTSPSQGPTSGQVQESQTPLDQRSFKQGKRTLAPRQEQRQAQRGQVVSFQGNFKQGQGAPNLGQRQPQGNQMTSVPTNFKQGQGTIIHGQRQGSQIPPQRSYREFPTPGQGNSQGNRMHSYQVGYSQGQGAQTPPYHGLPSNYGQEAVANYNQGPAQGNFVQGTLENYSQMGGGNYAPPVSENYGPAQGTASPHGQGRGGPLLSPYQGSYNQGQGTPMPGVAQVQGAWVPSYHGNYRQGTPSNYGQWEFVNYNQWPPHNYNQGSQWNFSPQNYGTAQFGHWYPGPNQYQLSYNGTLFPGQWQCQHCGMPQGHGPPVPPYHGTSAFNQRFPVTQGNYNPPSVGNYGPTHGSARNPGFGQEFPGHLQSQIFQQEDQRNMAGDRSDNNNPTDPTKTGKIPH